MKFLGLILVILSIVLLIGEKEKFDIYTNGVKIKVEVTNILTSCKESNSDINPRFRFVYKGKEYVKQIYRGYCEKIKRGKEITLITNKKNSIFIFPEENLYEGLVSSIVLLVIGVIISVKGFKQNLN